MLSSSRFLLRTISKEIPQTKRWCTTTAASSSSSVANYEVVSRLQNFHGPLPEDIAKPVSLATACQKEITKFKVNLAMQKIQHHSLDTGSAPVQIAVMTEQVMSLARHFTVHKKDKHSQRGFQILLARRRKMMKYLKKYDFALYQKTIKSLGLEKEASHI